MKRNPIFLSASVPYREPDRYVADPIAIREAVRRPGRCRRAQQTSGIRRTPCDLADGLGGRRQPGGGERGLHLSVPLVRPERPDPGPFLPRIGPSRLDASRSAPRRPDQDASLALMRDAMIVRRVLDEQRVLDTTAQPEFPEYAAGVFIGGMDGVEDEWGLFRQHYRTPPPYSSRPPRELHPPDG